jgi:hypothetical protein
MTAGTVRRVIIRKCRLQISRTQNVQLATSFLEPKTWTFWVEIQNVQLSASFLEPKTWTFWVLPQNVQLATSFLEPKTWTFWVEIQNVQLSASFLEPNICTFPPESNHARKQRIRHLTSSLRITVQYYARYLATRPELQYIWVAGKETYNSRSFNLLLGIDESREIVAIAVRFIDVSMQRAEWCCLKWPTVEAAGMCMHRCNLELSKRFRAIYPGLLLVQMSISGSQ